MKCFSQHTSPNYKPTRFIWCNGDNFTIHCLIINFQHIFQTNVKTSSHPPIPIPQGSPNWVCNIISKCITCRPRWRFPPSLSKKVPSNQARDTLSPPSLCRALQTPWVTRYNHRPPCLPSSLAGHLWQWWNLLTVFHGDSLTYETSCQQKNSV